MTETGLLIAAAAAILYALLFRRLARSVVTGPMIFLLLGWGLQAAGLLHAEGSRPVLLILAEATLTLVLFSDAAMLDWAALRRRLGWALRMLLIGLPLAMAFGAAAAWLLLPDWPLWEVLLIAAILSPTDAALGQAVVVNPAVPARIRESLTVESGLNDGLALPAVLMCACFAVGGVHDGVPENWTIFALEQIGFGAAAGVVLGVAGGRAAVMASNRGLSTPQMEGVAVLAISASCHLAATEVGGNGFVAAFVGGLAFGAAVKDRGQFVFEFMETGGQMMVLATFLLVGAVLLPGAWAQAVGAHWVLILASLLLLRPLAIAVSLIGADCSARAKLFMGWFGPRGLATALFALMVLEQFDLLTRGEEILTVASLAVLASAILHGATAAPMARRFGALEGEAGDRREILRSH